MGACLSYYKTVLASMIAALYHLDESGCLAMICNLILTCVLIINVVSLIMDVVSDKF